MDSNPNGSGTSIIIKTAEILTARAVDAQSRNSSDVSKSLEHADFSRRTKSSDGKQRTKAPHSLCGRI